MSWTTHSITEVNDAGFTQRCALPLSGVGLQHSPEVRWGPTDQYSGVWSDYADTYAGGVYLYATQATATTIPVIICTEMPT